MPSSHCYCHMASTAPMRSPVPYSSAPVRSSSAQPPGRQKTDAEGQEQTHLQATLLVGQRGDAPGRRDLQVGQGWLGAGPALVSVHLHTDACQQPDKLRVCGHKDTSVCQATGTSQQPSVRVVPEPRHLLLCLLCHWWQEKPAGLTLLHQEQTQNTLSKVSLWRFPYELCPALAV